MMFRKGWRPSPYSVITVTGFLFLWQGMVSLRLVNPFFLPSPLAVGKTLLETIRSGELLLHGGVTLGRIFHGFFWGALAGLCLGIPAGWSRKIYEAINPFIAATYPLPKVALLPLIIVYLGIGEMSRLVIISMAVFYVVLINTIAGVRNVDPILVMAAQDLGAKTLQVFKKVILPGALPMIFAGTRLGMGIAFLSTVVTEMIFGDKGLGYFLGVRGNMMDMTGIFAGLTLLGGLSILVTTGMEWVSRKTMPWSRDVQGIR
jgi:NitT/TauT family transport system permease protein